MYKYTENAQKLHRKCTETINMVHSGYSIVPAKATGDLQKNYTPFVVNDPIGNKIF